MAKIVVMGVAGCGKSSLGQAIARALGVTLVEGDDHHLPGSQDKMRNGIALDDADRLPWLARLGELLAGQPGHAVLSCSALKRRYREQLRQAVPGLQFVYLEIDLHSAAQRVQARAGHLFPGSLVASQFAALEAPQDEPGVLTVPALDPTQAQCRAVIDWLAAELAATSTPSRTPSSSLS